MVTMTLPVEVPLEDCEPDPRFLYRVRYDVDDLVESVRRGQIHPALAWRREDGKYMVFAGVRRLMAARAARERYGEPTTFLVRLVSSDTPIEEMWRLALDENVTQRKIAPLDLVKAARMAPEGALRGHNLTDWVLKELMSVARRIADEELEDLARVEEEFNSQYDFERHLTLRQIAELAGLDKYTRLVAAWLFLLNPANDVEDVRRAIRVGAILMPEAVSRRLLTGLEPPRFEEATAPPGAPHVKTSGKEDMGAPPPSSAPTSAATYPTTHEEAHEAPREGIEPAGITRVEEAEPVEEPEPAWDERVLRVLLSPGEDEFTFECPHCGRRTRVRIVRVG
ncbi:MAG: ParB N-terminal domain-containing protein [Conexivisphaerales archaeon]|jgi:hypothetical protein|nr:ParB N-terminal domain-containing protein [Conexivisphaerales archaeon]